MKIIKLLSSLVLVFAAISCSQDPILNETENVNLQAETTGFQKSSGSATLEAAMQINSFAIAKVARYNPAFRAELVSRLNLSSDDTISLDDLLSDIQFTAMYYDYWMAIWKIYNDPDPDVPATSPPPPPPGGMGDNEEGPDLLISYLRNQHCIEMYFPVGLDFSIEPYEITSTAHPLTSSSHNYGYIRFFDLTQVAPRVYRYAEYVDQVDQNYVNNNDNIIITRPYRVTLNETETCEYEEYEGIDFTDFLDQ